MKIQRPISEVFEAVVDPRQMERYFISAASARPTPGATVRWEWKDHDAHADVAIVAVEKDQRLVFRWPSGGRTTEVVITFTSEGDTTRVAVEEDGWEKNDQGIAALAENSGGWMNFLDCLKAHLEYGIQLRKGAF